ncbi:MAG TPA: hypothetical protein VI452_14545, partial [Marmoricola sp.]
MCDAAAPSRPSANRAGLPRALSVTLCTVLAMVSLLLAGCANTARAHGQTAQRTHPAVGRQVSQHPWQPASRHTHHRLHHGAAHQHARQRDRHRAHTTTKPEPAQANVDHSSGTVLAQLDTLTVKGRAPLTGYVREQFGQAWLDADRNGCDTRNDILNHYLDHVIHEPGTRDCVVLSGDITDPYTGARIHFVRGSGDSLDIDHVVALGDAWQT